MYVTIKQTSSAHPGRLSEEDLSEISFTTPSGEMLIPTLGLGPADMTRRDAGMVTIAVTFVCGTIAGEALKSVGKDIYTWVKDRLVNAMKKRREITTSSSESYVYHPPTWALKIETTSDELLGLTATITATNPEMMAEGAKAFSDYLEARATELDLSRGTYVWLADETPKGLSTKELLYELGRRGQSK
jgi:hypothetical protein